MAYFEPNGAPKEVQEQKAATKQTILVKFRNADDVRAFVAKTNIRLSVGRVNKITYPMGNSLAKFF